MDSRERIKVIVDEIRGERDKEILEMIDNEIESSYFMIDLSNLIEGKYYWAGRKSQAEVIKDFIINGKDDKK